MSYLGNAPGVSSQRTVTREIVSVASKTAFVPISGYSLGYVDVYVNGLQLDDTDFTATDGVNVNLVTAALNGDLVRIVAWLPRGLSDGYLKSEADAKYLTIANPSATGRFLGDFTNATVSSRLAFQTSTANSATGIYALPSGTGTAASWQATNAADPTNASKILIATNGSTDVQLVSGINGTGTYLPLTFYTGGSERVRVDTSGNVGVGTASPSQRIGIASGSDGTGVGDGIAFWGSSTNKQAAILSYNTGSYNGDLRFYTSAASTASTTVSERMRIDSSGNLLVNTTTAYGRISAIGAAGGTSLYLTDSTYSTLSIKHLSGFILSYETAGSASQAWTTNGAERMRLDSSGNVLLGCTTNGVAQVGINFSTLSSNPAIFNVLNTAGAANSYHLYNINATNNGYRFYVALNGGIYNYSGNNSNLSDKRTKKDIEFAGSYLEKICAIPVRTFHYKDEPEGEGKTLGVIAQEVEAVAPELVNITGFGDLPEDGVPLKSIYTNDMMFALMRAIQEQQALITQLQADVKTLKEAA
jgi:Chaperone of endosialidase